MYLCSAPRVEAAGGFDTTMSLADLVMGSTVETWFWTLPSNRFTDIPDLLISKKRKVLQYLQSAGTESRDETANTITHILADHHHGNIDEDHLAFTR